MCNESGPCENVKWGFDCMAQWEKDNPGDQDYACNFCGMYTAGKARCNKCTKQEKYTAMIIKGNEDQEKYTEMIIKGIEDAATPEQIAAHERLHEEIRRWYWSE